MAKKHDTALRILTAVLVGGFTGWLWGGDWEHYFIGAGSGLIAGVLSPWILPLVGQTWDWFVEQFERF